MPELRFTPGEKQWLKEHPVVRARVGAAPPLHFTEGTHKGISVDYLNLIAAHAGIRIDYVSGIPWSRALELIAGGETLDLILTAKNTVERRKRMAFTDDYIFMPWVIFTSEDVGFIGGMKDLSNKTVSVERGYVMQDKLKSEFPGINLLVTETSRQAIEAVASGSADAHIGNLTITSYIIQKYNLNNVKVAAPTPFDDHNQSMAVRKDWPELVGIINKILKHLTPEEHEKIRHRWLSMRYEYGISQRDIFKWFLTIGLFSLTIVGVVLFWNRKLQKEVLKRKKGEELLKTLFDTVEEAVFIKDKQFRYRQVNPAVGRLFNRGMGEILGRTDRELLGRKAGVHSGHSDSRALDGETVEEFHAGFGNGLASSYHTLKVPIRNPEGEITGICGITRDVTKLKRAEERLAESEKRYRQIFETNPAAKLIIDPDGGAVVEANEAACGFYGYSRDEITSLTIKDMDPRFPSGTSGEAENGEEGKNMMFTGRHRKVSGEMRDVEGLLGPREIRGKDVPARHRSRCNRARESRKGTGETRIPTPSGRQDGSRGHPCRGVAHDFNNILGIIIGNTELAMEDISPRDDAREFPEEIITAGLRARDVVRQLLSFSRKTEQKKRPMKIQTIIGESVRLLRASTSSSIEIRTDIPAELRRITGDPTQIHQVAINLCTNAAHAMEENGGTMEIALAEIELEAEFSSNSFSIPPGKYIRLRVADTGCGIDPAVLDKIFDPYFSTKNIDKGTGIGLSVVHGIVKNHGGAVSVSSEPGRGTVVNVLFPAVDEKGLSKRIGSGEIPGGNETLLFVDDEEAMVRMGVRILESLGYGVEACTDPVAALERFRSEPDRFDLVVTDMTMPGMTGDLLVREILKVRPGMPVILCTGFSEKIDAGSAVNTGISKYVEKPLDKRGFAEAIREVLDGTVGMEA